MPYFRAGRLDSIKPVLDLLTEIARARSAEPSQVALRLLIQQGTLPILGSKNARQARSNAGPLNITLDSAEMDALDQITRPWRG